jgi:integrase
MRLGPTARMTMPVLSLDLTRRGGNRRKRARAAGPSLLSREARRARGHTSARPPATGRLAFYRALRKTSGETVSPYDLRRTYAQWLDLARIPQFRQDYYMAHGPKDLNALYKRMRAVAAYLREDAALLGAAGG